MLNAMTTLINEYADSLDDDPVTMIINALDPTDPDANTTIARLLHALDHTTLILLLLAYEICPIHAQSLEICADDNELLCASMH